VNWSEQFPPRSPAPRSMGALVWDPDVAGVVLFGGTGALSFNDTWIWKEGAWAEAAAVGNVPPGRWATSADFDPLAKGMLLFGGFDLVEPLKSTWILYPAR
jgi:hypothetical protein